MFKMPWYIKLNFLLLALFVVGMLIYQMNSRGLPPGLAVFMGIASQPQAHQGMARGERRATLVPPETGSQQHPKREKHAGVVDKQETNP